MVNTTSLGVLLGALYLSYRGLGVALKSFFRNRLTVLNELENLGKPRKNSDDGRKVQGTVVIAGGSFAGLWTARVCSDHFERVLVIDPDSWIATDAGVVPEEPDVRYVGEDQMRAPVNKRANVAQYNSLHIFQVYQLWALRKVFPGWDEQFMSAGGMLLPNRYNMLYSGMPHMSYEHIWEVGYDKVHWCSRAFLETMIRRNVKSLCKNVEFVTGSVTGINADPLNPSKVASVSYKLKNNETLHTQDTILFVDCAGPTHNGLRWLADAGYGDKPNTSISADKLPMNKIVLTYNPKMVYSTSVWPVNEEQRTELERIIPGGYDGQAWFLTYLALPEMGSADCAMGRLENHRIQVLCGGWGGITLPRTSDEIVEFYRGMQGHRPVPDWVFAVLEVLFRRKDEGTFENVRLPQLSRVLYSKAVNLPTNFLAIGDACVRVNPVYGQGHSKGVMGAAILDSLLRDVSNDMKELQPNFASTFFELQERKVCSPIWDQTKTQDYNYQTTTPVKGESLSDGAFERWFSKNIMLASTWSVEVAKAFSDVNQFVEPSVLFFKPTILAKVLWEGITHRAA